jgi:hypothetical protein
VVGRSSWFEPLYPFYVMGSHEVAVVLRRGKVAKIDGSLIEPGGYRVKLLGEQLRKDGASRPRHPRGQVRFSPLRASDQTADVAVGIDEVWAGERSLKAEAAKECRRRGEGNSPGWRKGG